MFPAETTVVLLGLIVVEGLVKFFAFDLFFRLLFLGIVLGVGRLAEYPFLTVVVFRVLGVDDGTKGGKVVLTIVVSDSSDSPNFIVVGIIVVEVAVVVDDLIATTLALVALVVDGSIEEPAIEFTSEPEVVLEVGALGGGRPVLGGRNKPRKLLVVSRLLVSIVLSTTSRSAKVVTTSFGSSSGVRVTKG